ncbi:hypothetical protein ACN3E9_00365 [Vibrio pectenicida]|uniref:hypothetical protein n=1 Tax=Vibrio pectenicida TaxID=62763 RepID=UPI003B9CEEC1
MLGFLPFKKFIFVFISILILSACGGDGGGDSSPRSRTTATITGVVFDAPVSKADVTIYEFNNGLLGRELGTVSTSVKGEYVIDVDSASMPLYIEVKGGIYEDPLSGDRVEFSNGKPIHMASVFNYTEGISQQVMVTPLTYIVTGLAEFKIKNGVPAAQAIDDSISTVSSMYGAEELNVNSVLPIDITKGGVSGVATDGHLYGALLTAYASFAYDLLKESANGGDAYTSMNLSDIGYRDVLADGYLDGKELDRTGSFSQPIYFGNERIDTDFYTNSIAQHVMIVVTDPEINLASGLDSEHFDKFMDGAAFDRYQSMANYLNNRGVKGNEGVILSRTKIEIDETPPSAERDGNSVLKGLDTVELLISDDTGVSDTQITLRHRFDESEQWNDITCSSNRDRVDVLCWIDDSDFVTGPRETSLRVNINTTYLDSEDESLSPEAYLLVQTSDVMGNEDMSGTLLPLIWDNIAPIIEITSAQTINESTPTYILEGLVKEDPESLVNGFVYVSLSSGAPQPYLCTAKIFGSQTWCEFKTNGYSTAAFGDTANFKITTEDLNGNIGESNFTLYNDNVVPILQVKYPKEFFNFEDDQGISFDAEYSEATYNNLSVGSSTQYLKILYDYASRGVSVVHPELDFTDFNKQSLIDVSLPFVSATIFDDTSDENVYGSSADNLTLKVKYFSKEQGGDLFIYQTETTQKASDAASGKNVAIPFEALEYDADGKVPRMTYHIPYSKEVLDLYFGDKTSEDIQKLVISVIDASGNESTPQEVYFRSTFDMPEVTIVSPFINAQVRLEGLKSNGAFNYLKSCTTQQVGQAHDVASCTITYDSADYEFFRVFVKSDGRTHYYQWSKDESIPVAISTNDNLGAYFSSADKTTLYITEFSSYHTGLFDSQWDSLDSGEKTVAKAEQILVEVNSALNNQANSMLGFDPVGTPYATNEMLSSSLPPILSDEYIYRFLLESLTEMAHENSASDASSIDYASAFYEDLSYDGKADGQGESGQILVGFDELNSEIYRDSLARYYYEIVTDAGIESQYALAQADHFATANPTYGSVTVFDDAGGSIDREPPLVTLTPNEVQEEGAFTTTGSGNDFKIAGKVTSTLIIEDLATVDVENLKVFSLHNSKKVITDIDFVSSDESTKYRKVYEFVIDSQEAIFEGVKQFEIEVTAKDGVENRIGPIIVSTYYVDNQAPQKASVLVSPEFPTQDDTVSFSIEFSEPVADVEATFDGIDVVFENAEEYQFVWTGETSEPITLKADEASKQLIVKDTYHDEVNNHHQEFIEEILVTPTITVDDVTEDNIVNGENDEITQVVFSGTTKGYESGTTLTVAVASDKRPEDKFGPIEVTTNGPDGSWLTPSQNMTFWEEADFTVHVMGPEIPSVGQVTANKRSRYVDHIQPQVVQSVIEVLPTTLEKVCDVQEVLIDGQSALVTLAFNERVTQPTATLNGQSVIFEDQPMMEDVSISWVGRVDVLELPTNTATSVLDVSGYEDTALEPHEGMVFSKVIALKPVLIMDPIDDLLASDTRMFSVSGSSKGFENNAELTISVTTKNIPSQNYTKKANVGPDGLWHTIDEDISQWQQGTLLIAVNGENSVGQVADETSQEVLFSDDIVPSVDKVVSP